MVNLRTDFNLICELIIDEENRPQPRRAFGIAVCMDKGDINSIEYFLGVFDNGDTVYIDRQAQITKGFKQQEPVSEAVTNHIVEIVASMPHILDTMPDQYRHAILG